MSKKKKEETHLEQTSEPIRKDAQETKPAEADIVSAEAELKQALLKSQERAEQMERDLGASKDQYLRLAAEYDNFRKRSQKERESAYQDAWADAVSRLLPVYDNLERALGQPTKDEAYQKGVELTMAQLSEIFEKMGVREIPAQGSAFDPAFHNAVMHTEDPSLGDGVVAEVFQKGFLLGDKVIRTAMVKVAN